MVKIHPNSKIRILSVLSKFQSLDSYMTALPTYLVIKASSLKGHCHSFVIIATYHKGSFPEIIFHYEQVDAVLLPKTRT